MTFRINANSCKNAMGTVFLLAAAFFVCSTLVSMRSVFADPIVDTNLTTQQKTGRTSPRATANNRANVARTTTSRANSAKATRASTSRSAVSRGTSTVANKTVSSRGVTSKRGGNTATRNVKSRTQTTNRTTNNRAVRARTSTNQSRVSATGSVMASGSRASSKSYAFLTSRLYTGSYSNIIDSTTGLISADAYSNCMESYYTCMDEICTARSDTKGRCSCAGRATNFLDAENALEKANEELITLSGQLTLLIATKGKGDDLAAAFSLTDAEKVMNCVSYKEADDKAKWYEEHPSFDASGNRLDASAGMPSYCKESGNNFGFDIKDINGSSSDILAQLQAWADAQDLAKQYSKEDSNSLVTSINRLSGVISSLTNINTATTETATIDSMANKWGYKLFEYAHNNVCGRVLDSCFNGIYEACGTPPSVKDSDGKTHNKCANGATTSCPFNYNSAISVTTEGDVALNERTAGNNTSVSSASCFGYTTSSSSSSRDTSVTSSTDPYYTLRGPVADARRSIMQKYLLDANAACDTYGAALKQTAQNINYQKIAAEQALQQKRLEFKQEEESDVLAKATTAASNFDECLSELLDCYETQADNTTSGGVKWTEARIKTYCAQIAQVPHCYETMICNPSTAQFHAVIDMPDNTNCFNSQDYKQNTCRNIVTISEILYTASSTYGNIDAERYGNSLHMREQCLRDAGVANIRSWSRETSKYDDCTLEELSAIPNAKAGYKSPNATVCEYITQCNSGYMLSNNSCVAMEYECTDDIDGAEYAARTLNGTSWSACTLQSCKQHYTKSGNTCIADEQECLNSALNAIHAASGTQTWNGSAWGACVPTACVSGYTLSGDTCVAVQTEPEVETEP